MTKDYVFQLEMAVRDYECDIQGIVNNANYLHFLEHTRHQFLLSEGVSFIDLHRRGIDCVVARLTVSFKTPLRSDEKFLSCLNIRKEGVKYIFEQDIYRKSDEKLCIRATVDTVCIVDGRLADSQELNGVFAPYFKK